MTSSEFAARYRLLKNVATRGARSFLAQQVELGRMVMVHYLDAESADQQADMLARLQQLRGSRGDKLLEIADVDGTPVAVTLFISSFVDFAAWLDQVSPPSTAPAGGPRTPVPGDFTRAIDNVEIPGEAVPVRNPSEFTQFFGRTDFVEPGPAQPPSDIVDSPTLIMEPVKPPASEKAVVVPPPPPALSTLEPSPLPVLPPPAEASSGFTAIFGRMPGAPTFSPPTPPPSAPPPLPVEASSEPGEFTQLFQRLAPAGATPTPSFAAPVLPGSPFSREAMRPIDATPRADLTPPALDLPPAPSYGLPPGPAPSLGVPTMPSFEAVPPAPAGLSAGVPPLPLPSLGNNYDRSAPPSPPQLADLPRQPNGDALFGGRSESEFTRILGRVQLPPPPPIAVEPPSAAPAPAAQKTTRSMMPLILALNVVVLLTIAIVAYFVIRR